MASFLELFTFDSYYPASEKQLEPMKTVIFTDVRWKLNLGMEAQSYITSVKFRDKSKVRLWK